ncbi:MAG: hypothetical protein ND807_10115, partial [Vicinamibacterales bacterium]|nr:hypothetical protein [Vicinamibacterales bacterium]
FFPLEAKHYSGDTLFGLLLPVLAVWALEPPTDATVIRSRRMLAWWLAATIGHWLAYGSLFVAPACAVALLVVTWQRAGARTAMLAMLPGFLLVASFGAHYWLSMQFTLHNKGLQDYWWHAFPPAEAGVTQTLAWFGSRFPALARNPGGTRLWAAFWIAAIAGMALAFRHHRALGLVLVSVPISAFVFAGFGLVPLEERLSLWMLPSLYIAMAITVDRVRTAAAMAVAVVTVIVSVDIARAGVQELRLRPRSNHNLDDRAGVRFLMTQRQPGDVLVTMRMGLPAVWWYAGADVPALEARHHVPGSECRASDLATALNGKTRVALYLGFASDVPEGLQKLVLDTLSSRGTMTAYKRVAEEGVAAVFDLREPPVPWGTLVTPEGTVAGPVVRPPGCIGFFQQTRW